VDAAFGVLGVLGVLAVLGVLGVLGVPDTRGSGGLGSFASGGGVGTRGAVSDFGRGAPAGIGTIGFALPSPDREPIGEPRAPGDAGGLDTIGAGDAGGLDAIGAGDAVGLDANGAGDAVGLDAIGARATGVGCGDATATGAGSALGVINRSSARSRSSSSDEAGPFPPDDFGSATRDHHCRSMVGIVAM
jgi:hypothetical protein